MNSNFFEITLALTMVAVSVALVLWILGYLSADSQKRMMRMLKRAGLNPEIATATDTEAIMQQVRRRCRRCSSEDLCERWLAGEEKGDNAFCPNQKVFELLKREAESTKNPGYPATS